MAYANFDTGFLESDSQTAPRCASMPLIYCTIIIHKVFFVSKEVVVLDKIKALQDYQEPLPCSLLVVEAASYSLMADLIVRMGDGGVEDQGSAGQPYFLTLASWVHGDGGQHVKLNLIPGFPSLLSCIFIGAPGA